jgi:hypothetical protein
VIGIVGAVLGGWLTGAFFRETDGVDWLASIGVAMLADPARALGVQTPGLEVADRRARP